MMTGQVESSQQYLDITLILSRLGNSIYFRRNEKVAIVCYKYRSWPLILEKSVGSRLLAQALDTTALQKNTHLTEWVKLPLLLTPLTYIRIGKAQVFLKHCETNILHYNSAPNW